MGFFFDLKIARFITGLVGVLLRLLFGVEGVSFYGEFCCWKRGGVELMLS